MMMTGDWTIPYGRPRNAGGDAPRPAPRDVPDPSYADAVSIAFRAPLAEIPDDLQRLLARLN